MVSTHVDIENTEWTAGAPVYGPAAVSASAQDTCPGSPPAQIGATGEVRLSSLDSPLERNGFEPSVPPRKRRP